MNKKSPSLLFRLTCAVLCLTAFFAIPPQDAKAAGARYYVRGNGGNDSSSGTSWPQAFKNLQKALSVASSGDEIWVAAGVYYPDNGGSYPLDSRLASFIISTGLSVYGGFAGTESSLAQRNIAANVTILTGDVDNNDLNSDGNFIAEITGNLVGANAYHVVITSGTGPATLLDGFTITAGQADASTDPDRNGAGLYNFNGNPTLRNLTLQGNTAAVGGGIFNQGGALTLSNIRFVNNFALYNGGGMWNKGQSSLDGGEFSGNLAGTAGGGLMVIGTTAQGGPTLTNLTFSDNQAPTGGGLSNDSSNLSLTNASFALNIASIRGGGFASQGNSTPSLTNVTLNMNSSINGGGIYTGSGSNLGLIQVVFNGNQADFGAGMQNDGTSPTLFGGSFNSNIATQTGGGMLNTSGAAPYIEMVTFSANQADIGGGMYNYLSTPVLKNVDFLNNIAGSSTVGGGGMFNYTSSPSLTRVNFTGNKANSAAGGGIYNYNGSSPTITNASFTGNSALNGGGMRNHFNNNQPILTNVTFNANEAQFGGGVSNDNSTPTFYSTTFVNNLANQGGGMINYQSSPVLWNSTFYGNIAQGVDQGGGMYNISSSLPFLRNVILAGSTNGDCVNGAGGNISGLYSLIQDTGARACGAINGNQGFLVGITPGLGMLKNNGGFTLTLEPLPGSPVIDAVIDNFCMPSIDQRGFERFLDGDHNGSALCDIGAVEAGFYIFLPMTMK